jgi:cyclomaltodextrinase
MRSDHHERLERPARWLGGRPEMGWRLDTAGGLAAKRRLDRGWSPAVGWCLATAVVVLLAGPWGVRPSVAAKENESMSETKWASRHDRVRAAELRAREADWRNGPIVYQVIVDRFAPSPDLEARKHLYPAPKRLHSWDETPTRGRFLEEVQVWSHEIDFWGGTLASLMGRLDYIDDLGADVLYLNPIHQAYTNHKYDAQDFFAVSPEYGSREDVQALATACHERGMKLVLDGVFNHMGRTAPWFVEAMQDPQSPYRDWFYIGDEYKFGYRGWYDVANLPELRHENPAVRDRLWNDPDSAVQGYLRDGVDGWRLDVAFDLGFVYLSELTEAAHRAKAGSLVVGEIWNYPDEWSPAVDAAMNFYTGHVLLELAQQRVSGAQAGRLLATMIDDLGLENALKAWIVLDNHDTPRLRTRLPDARQRRIAQVLQFTLPGAPNVYYGVELGMAGGGDPEQRGPMRWDLVAEDNAELAWMKQLIELRRAQRALRIGDFRLLPTERALAFMRRTDRVAETAIILVNAADEPVTEVVPVPEAKLMNWTGLQDAFSAARSNIDTGTLRVTIPPRTARVFLPVLEQERGMEYSPFKRVQ